MVSRTNTEALDLAVRRVVAKLIWYKDGSIIDAHHLGDIRAEYRRIIAEGVGREK